MKKEKLPPFSAEIILRPRSAWLSFDWNEFFQYQDLLWLLVRRDIVARYKQTFFGRSWFVLQPLLMTIVFTVVFGGGVGISTDGAPRILFYLCGLLPWIYFSESLLSASSALLSNADMFRKIYFPRLIVPIATVLSRLFGFAVHFGILIAVYAYYKFFTVSGQSLFFGRFWWLLPLAFCQTLVLSLAMGLWVSALSVKRRDLQHAAPFLIQIWMYVSPVIYPVSLVSAQWHAAYRLNPMTWVIELYRHAFLGTPSLVINAGWIVTSLLISFFLLIGGFAAFNGIQRTLVDAL